MLYLLSCKTVVETKLYLAAAAFFFSSRRRHTRCGRDWSSDVCSSDLVPWMPGRLKPLSHTLLDADGDEHRRLRNLVRDTFTPSYVAHLEPRVQRITDELLDRLVPGGQADLVADFALPLPL